MNAAPGPDRPSPYDTAAFGPGFWSRGWLWLALAAATCIPSLVVTILPFGDLMNHIGRYHVFLEAAHDPFLQRYYAVHWSLIGNLGVDLLVRAIGPLIGAEPATHVVVGLIPPLTIAGIYALARSLHGAIIPPAALVAAPLALNWPLITGFVNFSLSAALALLVLALWIRLRALPFGRRLLIFAPLSFVVWVAHTAGWGLLSVGVGAYELARASRPWRWKSVLLVPLQTIPFALMMIVTMAWRSGKSAPGSTIFAPAGSFLKVKAASFATLFCEHFLFWDVASVLLFVALLLGFFVAARRCIDWHGAAIAAAFLITFLLCPQTLFHSGFADRRLLTYGAIAAAVAIGNGPAQGDAKARRRITILAAIAVAFFAARIMVASIVWHGASRAYESRLALIDLVPPHSRIFGVTVESCHTRWSRVGRIDHIQQFALPRRASMINGMYQNPGLNQVEMLFAKPSGFDPSVYPLVHDESCPVSYIPGDLQAMMRNLPRRLFDYVWIIGEEPLRPFDTAGLKLVASRGHDRLYRVVPAG